MSRLFVRDGCGIQDTGSGMEENQDPGSILNIPAPQHSYCPSGLLTEKREGYLAVCYASECSVASVPYFVCLAI
jgi:hypothetical protein